MALSVYRLFTRARPALSMKRLISPQSGGAQDSLGRCFARFQGTSSKLHESPTPESKPISRFPIPDRETLPEDIQRIMKEVEKQSGFLPNIFKIMSYDPKSFKYFFGYYDHLISDRGNLTKEDKSFISLAVSTENKCVYCTVSHRMVFRLNTNDPGLTDQMTVNWQTADLTDRQRAILELAMAVTKNEPITDEHFTNLERHGLDQRDAFDIGHYAAFFALANRLSTFTKLRPNEEFSDLKSNTHQLPKTHKYSLKNISYSYLQQDLSGI